MTEYAKALKEKAGSGTFPIVAVLSENVPDSPEQFEDILRNAVDPFSENIAILDLPKDGFEEHLEKFGLKADSDIIQSENISELCQKTVELLGCVPIVITCFRDEEKGVGERMLFLPQKDGFLRFHENR